MFLDDLPPLAGELLAGIIPAPFARGRLRRLELDAVKALVAALLVPKSSLRAPV